MVSTSLKGPMIVHWAPFKKEKELEHTVRTTRELMCQLFDLLGNILLDMDSMQVVDITYSIVLLLTITTNICSDLALIPDIRR